MALWDDQGPASQGKIVTSILKGDPETASVLLRRWSHDDLAILDAAVVELRILISKEANRRLLR